MLNLKIAVGYTTTKISWEVASEVYVLKQMNEFMNSLGFNSNDLMNELTDNESTVYGKLNLMVARLRYQLLNTPDALSWRLYHESPIKFEITKFVRGECELLLADDARDGSDTFHVFLPVSRDSIPSHLRSCPLGRKVYLSSKYVARHPEDAMAMGMVSSGSYVVTPCTTMQAYAFGVSHPEFVDGVEFITHSKESINILGDEK